MQSYCHCGLLLGKPNRRKTGRKRLINHMHITVEMDLCLISITRLPYLTEFVCDHTELITEHFSMLMLTSALSVMNVLSLQRFETWG